MKTKTIISGIFLIICALFMNSCGRLNNSGDNKVLMPVKDDPTVSFRIWFKVGSQNDPKGKEGIAELTANMLVSASTQTHSYENLLDLLYPMASGYDAKVDKEMTVISGRTHKDNLKEYTELLTDAILKPAFKEEDFTRIKEEMLNYIEKELSYASDEELGKAALYNFVFEGTPYGHIDDGTVESLKSITFDDVKQFYKKYYTKDNFVIGLGGGYDDEFLSTFEAELNKLPAGKVEDAVKPKYEKIDGLNFLLVDKECDATAISFGFPVEFTRGDDDFYAMALFASWFGEHRNSSSHLYQVIREIRGLNYGDYAYVEAFLNGSQMQMPMPNNARRQQIFEVWLRPVPNVQRHFVLRAALRELKLVVDNGITKEAFETTKKFLYKYSLNFAPTTSIRLGYQIDSRFYGVEDNGNYIDYFRNKINGLTLEQVNKAIKKYLQYNNIKFGIVTQDASKFKDELVNNTPSPIVYPTPKPQSVMDEDKIIEAFPLKVSPDKVRIVKVTDLFLK
ncbi:MAG: insulinase family protein [Ignavibacteriae bacterium]|nr:insulinase family protein [Ignavibacteriota bacterium]